MKILVTGATGYIGAHLVKKLAELGHDVSATDLNLNQNDISKYVSNLWQWDIRQALPYKITNADAVIHLAAKAMVAPSVSSPWVYYDTNINGTRNVLETVPKNAHFIYCSTGAAHIPESSPYAMSKRAAEDIVKLAEKFSICRFFNVSGNDGFKKFDPSHYHLIRKLAATANGKYESVTVFGTDFDTSDGTAIRNFTHVSDIVDSIVRVLDNGPTGKIENLGNAKGHSVLEVVKTMKQVSGVDFAVKYAERRPGDCGITILPNQSEFFIENFDLAEQCKSAIAGESDDS